MTDTLKKMWKEPVVWRDGEKGRKCSIRKANDLVLRNFGIQTSTL
jgi:hypothetical protein